MYARASVLASAALPALIAAGSIPTYSGMSVVWSAEFAGAAGDSVDTDIWNIATCESSADLLDLTAAGLSLLTMLI